MSMEDSMTWHVRVTGADNKRGSKNHNKKIRPAENQRGTQSVSLIATWGRMTGGTGHVDRGVPQYVWGRRPLWVVACSLR